MLAAAQAVTEAVAAHEPAPAAAIGVDLERVRAEFLHIASVEAAGTGFVDAGGVRAALPSPGVPAASSRSSCTVSPWGAIVYDASLLPHPDVVVAAVA